MTGLAARIRPVLTTVNSGLDVAESALRRAELLEQKFREAQTREQVELEAMLKGLVANEHSLSAQLAEATAKEAEARAEEEELRAGRRLDRFLQERSGSSDYRSHLGLISLLHQDLEQLSNLLQLAEDDKNGQERDGSRPRIDRIVLYVDDLDRCPPARVVEVLQAIHLLLALPLFVVVVGVDPRWLLRSLQRHYRALLTAGSAERAAPVGPSHWASTPQNYLEKIFQIPFALAPMTGDGFSRLVDDLAAGTASRPENHPIPAPGPPNSPEEEVTAKTGPAQLSTAPSADEQDHENQDSQVPDILDDVDAEALSAVSESVEYAPNRKANEAADRSLASRHARSEPFPVAPQDQKILAAEGPLAYPQEDPNPAGLKLTDHEIIFIQALAPLVTTPRAAKRLINIYLMIRSTQVIGDQSHFLDRTTGGGSYRAVLQLLAIVSGYPHLAAPTLMMLMQAEPGTSWKTFVDMLPNSPLLRPNSIDQHDTESQDTGWHRLQAGLVAVRNDVQVPDELGPYSEWAPRVARFSFSAGRILAETFRSVATTRNTGTGGDRSTRGHAREPSPVENQ
jgi:hypothetical protein